MNHKLHAPPVRHCPAVPYQRLQEPLAALVNRGQAGLDHTCVDGRAGVTRFVVFLVQDDLQRFVDPLEHLGAHGLALGYEATMR